VIKTDVHEVFDVTLDIKTPIYIGSGKKINKKEYALDREAGLVRIIDMSAFMKLVVEKGIVDKYEKFILDTSNNMGMFEFLKLNFSPGEIKKLVQYECDAKNIYDNNRSLLEIHQFMRMPDGRPYIPGSSLKGAIRTCLLADMILRDPGKAKALINIKNRDLAKTSAEEIETEYFNTLNFNAKNKKDLVNSIMRAVYISDSEPIYTSSMTLCRKIDILPNGETRKINLLRECIKPQIKVKFRLTIDRTYGCIGIEKIKTSIRTFAEFYRKSFLNKFDLPGGESLYKNDMLILGGGTGFFSKTIVYETLDYDSAVSKLSDFFMSETKAKKIPEEHRHNLDKDFGVSPHTMKYTEYYKNLVPMGICSITFD